jgi:hypothetical protein
MRTTWLCAALVAGLAVIGCGSDDASHGGGMDLSVPDMTMRDLIVPTACNPTDPMNDGSACSAGCPANTIGVNLPSGECKCLSTCNSDPECSCNRFCDVLSKPDAGVVGKACVPGNTPGERCSTSAAGAPYYNRFCGQLTTCVNADAARMFRYCNYKCESQADCPAQTTCQPLLDSSGNAIGNVCAYVSGPNGNKDLGQACAPASDVCKAGQLCDGMCRPQCDGPGAACATGTCTEADDPASGKVIGYVCK